MNGSMEGYDEVEAIEGFDDFESTGEARFRPGIRPGRRVVAPGVVTAPAVVTTASLDTPRGRANLTMPAPVVTWAAHQALVQAVNANTQRLNEVLARVHRELALRPRDQGQNMLPLILTLKLQQDLKGHTHTGNNTPPTFPTASGGGLSSGFPLMLLLIPGVFGQFTGGSSSGTQSSGTQSYGTQNQMSQLFMMMFLLELFP
jgi:hypothetical protein